MALHMDTSAEFISKNICPTCKKVLPQEAAFCGYDGTQLPCPLYCPKCYGHYPASAKFCPHDGQALTHLNPLDSANDFDGKRTTKSPAIPEEDECLDESMWSEETLVDTVIAGKYHLDELLGRGGMAEIYRATQLNIGKSVVIKVMHRSLSTQSTSLKRFQQECRVTAQIDHPNIVSVYDTGISEDQRPYLVMEFIDGESLRDRLSRDGVMDFALSAQILMAVCAGLDAAHQQGVIHRDLKPENIMLRNTQSRPDWVKIVDFGIARLKEGSDKLTKTGMTIGTMDYLAPEYLRDQIIDQRCDIYALGIILYELITGHCPFIAHTSIGVVAKHLWGTIEQPSKIMGAITYGGTIDRIVQKCLEKDPQNRYQSVLELQEDLKQALESIENTTGS